MNKCLRNHFAGSVMGIHGIGVATACVMYEERALVTSCATLKLNVHSEFIIHLGYLIVVIHTISYGTEWRYNWL